MNFFKHFSHSLRTHQSVIIALFVVCVLIAGMYYDVVFLHKTLLSPGITAGVMGDDGPYGFEPQKDIWEKYALFLKDLGSNAWQGEPQSAKVVQIFKQWALPLWNDNVQLGKPLAANFLSTAFFPLKLVVYLSPNAVGWEVYLLLRFAVGVFFTYLFLRQLGVKHIPSMVGGVSFAFSGYFVLFQNIQNMDVDLLAPLLFWAVAYITALYRRLEVRPLHYLISVGAVVTVFLSNIPESLLLLLVAGGIFLVYRLISTTLQEGKAAGAKSLHITLRIIVPSVLFVSPLYFLNAEFVQNAFTLHTSEAALGKIAWKNISFVIHAIIPYITNPNFLLPTTPVPTATLNYIGIVGFFIAIFGMFDAFHRRGTRLFLFFLGVVIIAKIYGYPNFLNELIGGFPGLDRVLFIKYANLLVSFAIACLVGFGLDSMIQGKIRRSEYGIAVSLFIMSILLGIQLLQDVNISATNIILLVVVGLLLMTISFILVFQPTVTHRHLLGGVLGCMLIAELFLLIPRHDRPERHESFAGAPYVQFLQQQPQPFRVFGLDRLLYPELSSAFDIDDIRDVDGLYVDTYFTYIKTFISPSVYDRFTGAAGTGEEAPVQFSNNPFFDLLNVRYIITKTAPIEIFPRNAIIDAFLATNTPTPSFREMGFTINTTSKRALLIHAPNSACTALTVPHDAPVLSFVAGINQSAWGYPGSDGVVLQVTVNGTNVLSTTINPTEDIDDRKWLHHAIDLSSYIGQNPTICFTTDAQKTSLADHSGIADLRFTSSAQEKPTDETIQYRSVYDNEVLILENTSAYPRGFIVGDVIVRHTEEEVISTMQQNGFNPRVSAVILERKGDPSLPLFDGEQCTSNGIQNYEQPNPNHTSFTIESPANCLLVWSETEYPGWQVIIDGEKGSIYQTDVLLRGVPLTPGTHHVEFRYRPVRGYIGLLGTLMSIVLLSWWTVVFSREKQKTTLHEDR